MQLLIFISTENINPLRFSHIPSPHPQLFSVDRGGQYSLGMKFVLLEWMWSIKVITYQSKLATDLCLSVSILYRPLWSCMWLVYSMYLNDVISTNVLTESHLHLMQAMIVSFLHAGGIYVMHAPVMQLSHDALFAWVL